MTCPLFASPLMQICLAEGSQSLVEQAVFGFFLVLFFVAVAVNVTWIKATSGVAQQSRIGSRRRASMPASGRSWTTVWARCVWELDILKTYLAETSGVGQFPQSGRGSKASHPKRRVDISSRQAALDQASVQFASGLLVGGQGDSWIVVGAGARHLRRRPGIIGPLPVALGFNSPIFGWFRPI